MSITPTRHTVDSIYSNKYYIDFYQRDYKWSDIHVNSLLDDLFFRFEIDYRAIVDVTPESIARFAWYYLSTFVTNDHAGKKFIVDGQQRFTTLTLILIKLYHLAKEAKLEGRVEWLKSKIYGTGAEGKSYWMGTDERSNVLDEIFKRGSEAAVQDADRLSIRNILSNYRLIDSYVSGKLQSIHKLEAFILYLLTRVELIEILIDDARDVTMVFEVINDRGERLKPYEVFKGELLGQLDKSEVDPYYEIWREEVGAFQNENESEVDNFFRSYFRAKFVDSRNLYRDFDGEYQKTVFSGKWARQLGLKRNPKNVKEFLKQDFSYFAKIYLDLLTQTKQEGTFLNFNWLNDQDRQYLLIHSAISLGDPDEREKIDLVARLLDRNFTLLHLLSSYDSNSFNDSIISLNTKIRAGSLEDIQASFDEQLLEDVSKVRGVNIRDAFQWSLFRNAGYGLGSRFIRYFFARVEHYIASRSNLPPANTFYNLVRTTRSSASVAS